MKTNENKQPERKAVLCKAFFNSQQPLGLTQEDLGRVIGLDRTTVSRLKSRGQLDPGSKEGELATYLIRIYRSLFALMGGDQQAMQHWMHTNNHHINGRPLDLIGQIQGLVRTLEYLDAIRGKI